MKCVDCKIIKFDGKNYTCPAHPYKEGIDLYTEHRNCGAIKWYPGYVEDKLHTIEENVRELDIILPKLYRTIQELANREGYGASLREDLNETYQKYVNKYKKLSEEHEELLKEKERLGRN